MTCRHCMNWNMKNFPTMARQGLANCNLQPSKAVFYPAHHDCTARKPVTSAQALARDRFLKGVGL